MKKVAFFVEGMTEMLFLERLLAEVMNVNKYAMQIRTMRGGSKSVATITVIKDIPVKTTTECFILITECGGDSTVKSYILEQRVSLISSGYSAIVGIVDLYPKELKDLHKWQTRLLYYVPQTEIPISFVIPVMEIEAWFIAETTHFQRIDARLDKPTVNANLGFDVDSIDVTSIAHPSHTLNDIYQIAGESYIKKKGTIQKTVDVLDYGEVYFELPKKIDSLKQLLAVIDSLIVY